MPPLLLALILLCLGPVTTPLPLLGQLTADTVILPPEGPRVVLLGTPGSGVAALRLFVPVDEAPLESGVGQLLADLASDRMAGLARPVGARSRVVRTPRGLAYEAEGAVADFEYLAYLLREAAGRPEVSDVPFTRALNRLSERVSRVMETPEDRIASELHSRLDPTTPPLGGTSASLEALTPARVLELWQRTHQPARMTLVASAGVLPEVILAATRSLGSDDPTAARAPFAPTPAEAPDRGIEILRSWFGVGWAGPGGHPPEGPVTALLLAEMVEGLPTDAETILRLVELPDRWGLLLMGATYDRRRALETALMGTLEALAGSLDASAVEQARTRVHREFLASARTPMGLVDEVGWRMERSGDAYASDRYRAALEAVDLDSVLEFLDALRSGSPVRAEIRP